MKSLVIALAIALLAGSAHAQFMIDTDAVLNEPMPLMTEALGDFSRPISSNVPEAQAYFDQGMQLMYAFAKPEAKGTVIWTICG